MIRSIVCVFLFLCPCCAYSMQTTLKDVSWDNEKIELEDLRRTYSHLNDHLFEIKFQNSLKSPLLFMRSFVNTYYKDSGFIGSSTKLIPCFGDAHPENFGFLLFDSTVRYTFNDLDDSGPCPFELDVLRYFSTLSLYEEDRDLVLQAINTYIEVFAGSAPIELMPSMNKSLKKKTKNILKKYSQDSKFKLTGEMIVVDEEQKKKMISQIRSLKNERQWRVLDLVQVDKNSGGSAGLSRYWLLGEDKQGQRDILELKELTTSAVDFGPWAEKSSSQADRLERLKKDFWGDSPEIYHLEKIESKSFLLRSRSKDDFNLEKMAKDQKGHLYQVQASLMAAYHRNHVKIAKEELKAWLIKNVEKMKERYQRSYKSLVER